MKGHRDRHLFGERIYALFLRFYPAEFRSVYGSELMRTFADWHREPRRGLVEVVRFWFRAMLDLVASVPREWRCSLSARRASGREAGVHQPPYLAAAATGVIVFGLYVATLGPTIGFWDSGEYVTAAHISGIPHPPGSPLFVLVARAWELMMSPIGLPAVVSINLFGAALSAVAHGLWFLVVDRGLAAWKVDGAARRIAAAAAVLVSATAFTVWNQSNVVEKVYSISFVTTALVCWLALRWRDTGRKSSWLILVAFVLALTATNHLMGVLVAPALLVFVLLVDRRALARPRLWAMSLPLVILALSVQFFLPIRAAQQPVLAEGAPVCESIVGAAQSIYTWGGSGCDGLSGVLSRAQYGKPPILLDPTVYPQQEVSRGVALFASQLTNYLQYFDWQWARSAAGADSVFGGFRPLVSLFFVLLGLIGARQHWRVDRPSAAMLVTLFVTLSAGLVLYLNFRYGYSLRWDRFPDTSMHEVRERDYFFVLSFSVWGLWAGIGTVSLWRRAAAILERNGRPRLAASPLLALAFLPLLSNWHWASRADDYTARDWAYNVLMSVAPYGVLVTNGDNDTFPLWYLQEVEGIRRDVTVIVNEYLNTPWYAKQLRQLTEPCRLGQDPTASPSRIVCQRPFQPGELPAPLLRFGWVENAKPPSDSIFPLTDEEIDALAGSYFVARDDLLLTAGGIETTIAAGTPLLPADSFVAAMLKSTIDDRPIHFMPASQTLSKLGLAGYTVRQGLTLRIHDGRAGAAESPGVVRLPATELSPVTGATIDLALTDTLLSDVFVRRGRIMDPEAPWTDAASASIPTQYVYAHLTASEAHASLGDPRSAERHARQAQWWEGVATN